jgi:hypothetical protein
MTLTGADFNRALLRASEAPVSRQEDDWHGHLAPGVAVAFSLAQRLGSGGGQGSRVEIVSLKVVSPDI